MYLLISLRFRSGSDFNPELSQLNQDFYPRYKLGLILPPELSQLNQDFHLRYKLGLILTPELSQLNQDFHLNVLSGTIVSVQVWIGGWPLKGDGVFEHRITFRGEGGLGYQHETLELSSLPLNHQVISF